jgi:hypothetical protein
VTVAEVRASVAFEGELKLTRNVWLGSCDVSPLIVTVIEAVVVPALKVAVPVLET